MKKHLLLVAIKILCISVIGYSIGRCVNSCINESKANDIPIVVEEEVIVELPTDPVAFFNQSPEEGLIEALDYYGIQYPQIVHAQALLETGHFTSRICKEYNNLFGLYNSTIGNYYSFEHWSDSVIAYRDFVQYKYNGDTDYYTFLIDLPYATDPDYIRKIKQLEHKYYE